MHNCINTVADNAFFASEVIYTVLVGFVKLNQMAKKANIRRAFAPSLYRASTDALILLSMCITYAVSSISSKCISNIAIAIK